MNRATHPISKYLSFSFLSQSTFAKHPIRTNQYLFFKRYPHSLRDYNYGKWIESKIGFSNKKIFPLCRQTMNAHSESPTGNSLEKHRSFLFSSSSIGRTCNNSEFPSLFSIQCQHKDFKYFSKNILPSKIFLKINVSPCFITSYIYRNC